MELAEWPGWRQKNLALKPDKGKSRGYMQGPMLKPKVHLSVKRRLSWSDEGEGVAKKKSKKVGDFLWVSRVKEKKQACLLVLALK